MKSFKNFKDYVFTHLFPIYYKENDTYKNEEGKGILERFIDSCTGYIDDNIMPDIDNFMDLLDVEKTPELFLNYFWEYFDYIPYAYGVLTRGEPYTKENVYKWLNSPEGFPKADTRKILKYAISLFKIRGTEDFFTVLGRFYGVRFKFDLVLPIDEPSTQAISEPEEEFSGDSNLVIALWEGVCSVYLENGSVDQGNKAGWPWGSCWSCDTLALTIYIPYGMYKLLEEEGRLEEVKDAFAELINKYLPLNVRLYGKNDEHIILVPDIPTLLVDAPVMVPISTSEADLNIPAYSSTIVPPAEFPTTKVVTATKKKRKSKK